MNYFDLYLSYPDQAITAAWDAQLVEAAQTPGLKEILLTHGSELFPRFAAFYAQLRALPRGARRALQRQIARSSELAAIFPEWLQSGGGRALQQKLARSLAGAALLLALGQGVATAATIPVTTNDPRVRADGQCSLIEAIINANNDAATHADCAPGSGADTIVLPADADVALRAKYDNTYGRTGLPLITSSMTIEGNGARIVRRGARKFRLLAVSNSGNLTLQDLTLSKGSSVYGGGVFNNGTLTVANSTITGNKASSDGGGVSNRGTLSIDNSTISKNSAPIGGGVYNSPSGTLTIDNTTISGNKALSPGGGLFNHGAAEIAASTISNNSAFRGGGAYNSHTSSLTIIDSIVSDNKAAAGGGVFNHRGYDGYYSSYPAGHLTIENSAISGNKASEDGGGVFNSGGYVSCYSPLYCYYTLPGDLSLVDSTISGNRAKNRGGGLFHYGSPDMSNSTISDNKARVGPDIFP
jgi:hypothetical protein